MYHLQTAPERVDCGVVLSCLQFFVSTALIIATIVVYQQLHFMQNKKLGYDKEQVLFLPDSRILGKDQDALRKHCCRTTVLLPQAFRDQFQAALVMDGTEIYPKNETSNGTEIHTHIFHVDYDYLRTLGIHITSGRNFSRDFPTDSSGVVINEAAVRELGWTNANAVGKTIIRSGQIAFKVIGVTEDFNYASVKEKVAPIMMILGGNYGGVDSKIGAGDIKGFLNKLKTNWASFNPQGPLGYYFLDENFARLYAGEQRTQKYSRPSQFSQSLSQVSACLVYLRS